MMRRVATAILFSACVFAVSAVGAYAGQTKSVSYTLSGTAEWSADFLPPSFAIHGDVFDGKARIGTYSGTMHSGAWESYTLGRCTEGPECAPVTGGTITFKLKGSELQQAVSELVVDLAGPASLASGAGDDSDLAGWARRATPVYLNLRKASIYGGSNEVQRQIIAKTILGL